MHAGVPSGVASPAAVARRRPNSPTVLFGLRLPSELIRPGAAIVRVKDQFSALSTFDLALYEANSVHAQELGGGVNIAIAQTISAAAERDAGEGATEDSRLEGIQLSAQI